MENIEYKGCQIVVEEDTLPLNPRTEWDNFGRMICFHNRYNLGDKHDLTAGEVADLIKNKEVIALPLRLYDHSGVSISTSSNYPYNDPWDSGFVGWILASKEDIRKEYKVKRITRKIRQKVIDLLQSEVQVYDAYIRGNVYGYSVLDENGQDIDSCYGFYGYDFEKSGLLQAAKESIDSHLSTDHNSFNI